MNWIKGKLRGWLFPEYEEVCGFMDEIREATKEISGFMVEVREAKIEVRGKSITFKEPVVLVGNITSSSVSIKPTINPEIILSSFEYESLLKISGNHHLVNQNKFDATRLQVK